MTVAAIVRGALLAGAIAFLIYTTIGLLTGSSLGATLPWAGGYFVTVALTAVVVLVILRLVRQAGENRKNRL